MQTGHLGNPSVNHSPNPSMEGRGEDGSSNRHHVPQVFYGAHEDMLKMYAF